MVVRQTGLQQGLFAASQSEIDNIKLELDAMDMDMADLDFAADPMLCDDGFNMTLEEIMNLC